MSPARPKFPIRYALSLSCRKRRSGIGHSEPASTCASRAREDLISTITVTITTGKVLGPSTSGPVNEQDPANRDGFVYLCLGGREYCLYTRLGSPGNPTATGDF